MNAERLKKYFDPAKVIFDADFKLPGACYPGGFIVIGENLKEEGSIEDKVVTIIQELLHLERGKEELIYPINSEAYYRHEGEIDAEAIRIYNEHPDFVKYIEHTTGLIRYDSIEREIDKKRGQLRFFD